MFEEAYIRAIESTVEEKKSEPPVNYRVYDMSGSGTTHDFYAENREEAKRIGREWIESGDWGEAGKEPMTLRSFRLPAVFRFIQREALFVDVYAPGTARDIRGPYNTLAKAESVAWAWEDSVEVALPISGSDFESSWDVMQSLRERYTGFVSACPVTSWARSASSEDCSTIYRVAGPTVPINDELTLAGEAYDCSGRYSDKMPECEAHAGNPYAGEQGHSWVQSHECCGRISSNPGVWHGNGTSMRYKTVCVFCGMLKTEITPGNESPNDESVIKLESRNEATTAWLKRQHVNSDGFIPEWLATYLGCSMSVRMTEEEAVQWARDLEEDAEVDALELEHAFTAIYDRRPDQQTREEGLLSHVYAGIK